MTDPKGEKNNEKKKTEPETPKLFSFLATSNGTTSTDAAMKTSSQQAKPFVFGAQPSPAISSKTDANNADSALSHTASISALMEQRSKMANARRKNNKQDSTKIKPAAALKTDSTTEKAPLMVSTTSESSSFAFSPTASGDAFSPGSSTSISRQRRAVGTARGRRNKTRKDPNTARKSSPLVNKAEDTRSPSFTKSSKAEPTEDRPSGPFFAVRRDSDNDDSDEDTPPTPPKAFERAPASELRKRQFVRARRPSDADYSKEDDDSAKEPFERASTAVLDGRKVVRAKRDNVVSNGSASSAAAADSSSNVAARAVSDEDDDSMPPLEKSNGKEKKDTAGEQNYEDAADVETERDDDDDASSDDVDAADSRGNRYAALAESEDGSSEEQSEEESEEDSDGSEEEDDDSDYDPDEECMCEGCVAARMRTMDASPFAFATGEDCDEQCCICFGSPTSTNRFAILPCCGSESGEDTSTVKFCNRCIVKCLQSQNSEIDSFYDYLIRQPDYTGECPRCRALIAVTRRDATLTNRPNLVKKATFRQAVRLALRDKEKGMRPILYTACCVYPYFMPLELFEDEEEKLKHLCRWGVLKEVRKGQVYAIDPKDQVALREIAEMRYQVSEEDDDESNPFSPTTMLTMRASVQLFFASFYAIMKFKVVVACRMFNQGIAMFMIGVGALPRGLHRRWQGMIVTCLNMLLLTMVLQVLFLFITYILIGYGTVKATGWWLSTPNSKSLMRRLFYTSATAATMYGIFRVSKYDLIMYSSMAIGVFAGGCHVSGMKMSEALRKVWEKMP